MNNNIYSINGIRSALDPVLSKYNIKKATLFGSYAKGTATSNSDVDLFLDSGLRGLSFVGLIEEIHSALGKDVDVFDVTHIIPGSLIYKEINKDGVTIYET